MRAPFYSLIKLSLILAQALTKPRILKWAGWHKIYIYIYIIGEVIIEKLIKMRIQKLC